MFNDNVIYATDGTGRDFYDPILSVTRLLDYDWPVTGRLTDEIYNLLRTHK